MDDLISGVVGFCVVVALVVGVVVVAIWMMGQVVFIGLAAVMVSIPMLLLMGSVFLAAYLYHRERLTQPGSLLKAVKIDAVNTKVDFSSSGESLHQTVDYTMIRLGLAVVAGAYIAVCLSVLAETPAASGRIQCTLGVIIAAIAALYILAKSAPTMRAALSSVATRAVERGGGTLAELRELGEVVEDLKRRYAEAGIEDHPTLGAELQSRLAFDNPDNAEQILSEALSWIKTQRDHLASCLEKHEQVCCCFAEVAMKVNRLPVGSFLVAMDELHGGLYSEQLIALLESGDWQTYQGLLAGIEQELELINQRIDEIEQHGWSDAQHQQAPPKEELESLYEEFGITAGESFAEMKKKVRAVLAHHHPDNRMYQETTEAMRKLVTQRFQALNNAWERLQQLLVIQ